MVMEPSGYSTKFLDEVLWEVEQTSAVSFKLKSKLNIDFLGEKLTNFIFVESNEQFYPLSEIPQIYEDYDFCTATLEPKTHYLDYELLTRYYAMKLHKEIKDIDMFNPSEVIKFPHNVILPLIHIRYVGFPLKKYIDYLQYSFNENVGAFVKVFNKFLNDISESSWGFLKLKRKVFVQKWMILDSYGLKSNYPVLYRNEGEFLKVPRINLTVISYLFNTYKLSYTTYLTENAEYREDAIVVIPTIYDIHSRILSSELLTNLKEPKADITKFFTSIFEILTSDDIHKKFYFLPYEDDRTLFIDMGELIIGFVRFGIDRGILFLRKIVRDGKVYLKIIPNFSRVVTEPSPEETIKIYMNFDKFVDFVSSYSRGRNAFFIEPNLNKLIITHMPITEPQKTYYTELKLSDVRDKLGVVNGYLVVGGKKIKIFKTYGYYHAY